MINWFGHLYPYTNIHELNLDWVINTVKAGEDEIKNFVGLNTIKYADPILWDITSQYEKNTVVVDGQTGNAYISTQPVPVGVALSRTEYWTAIFNYGTVVDTLMSQIASNEGLSPTATQAYNVGDLVFFNSLLYRVIAPMIAGDSFVIDSNVVKTTINDELVSLLAAITTNAGDITTLSGIVGNLADLTTTDKTSIVNAINEVNSAIASVGGNVGALADLNTTDKTSIVNAINEVLTVIGSLSNLNTTDKSSIVNAINDVLATIGDLSSLNTTDKSSVVNSINEVVSNQAVLNGMSVYNVRSYGAKGDGTTDDTQAILDATTDVNATGGILYFPSGSYKFNDTINISKVGVSIVGDNQQATYILQQGNRTTIHCGVGAEPALVNMRVENLSVVNQYAGTLSGYPGIHYDYCVNSIINNVVVAECQHGIRFTHTGNSFITNTGIVSSRSGALGFILGNRSVSISLNNVYVGFNGTAADDGIGLYSTEGDIADFVVNYLDVGNGAYGIYLDGNDSPNEYPPTDIRLNDIIVDGSRIACIHVSNINGQGSVTIDGGWLNPNVTSGNKCINLNNVNNISVVNVVMQQLADSAPLLYGVVASTGTGLQISNCKFLNIQSAVILSTIDRVTIDGNMIELYNTRTSTAAAIYLGSTYNAIVNGNGIYGSYDTGISYTTGDHGIVTCNRINGATTSKSVTITDVVDDNNL